MYSIRVIIKNAISGIGYIDDIYAIEFRTTRSVVRPIIQWVENHYGVTELYAKYAIKKIDMDEYIVYVI